MSEKEESNQSNKKEDDSICRDFLRNVCFRGERCKYSHPADRVDPGVGGTKLQDKMEFCHDFQNGRCSRSHCKFIHCTSDVEAEFKKSGYLPPSVRDQVIIKGVAVDFPATAGGIPICKDYLKGRCTRDGRCKFRHVNAMEYDLEMNAYQSRRRPHNYGYYEDDDGGGLYDRREGKRRCLTMNNYGGEMVGAGGPPPHAFQMLQEENMQLRTQLQEMEKRVSDLTATNEFLLDQNAQLRMGVKQPPASVSVSGGQVVPVSGLGGPSSSYCY